MKNCKNSTGLRLLKKKVDCIKERIEDELSEKDLKRILISPNKVEEEEKKLLKYLETNIFDTLLDKLAETD